MSKTCQILAERHSIMTARKLFERPTIMVAVIASVTSIAIAISSLISGSISAYFQRQSDIDRSKTTILLQILPEPSAYRVEFTEKLIQSGALPDADGAICMAFVGRGCPIKVLKSN